MGTHKVCIMTLSSSDAGMSKQKLDRPNIRAIFEQTTCKRIAESVGMRVDARELAQPGNRPAKILDARLQRPAPAPEEVVGVAHRETAQGCDRLGVQQDLERRPGFHRAQDQVTARLHCRPPELRRIRDPQPGVQQQEHQPASPSSHEVHLSRIVGPNAVARQQEGVNVGLRERQRRRRSLARCLELRRQVAQQPAAIHAERTERPQSFQFLPLSRGLQPFSVRSPSGRPPAAQRIHAERGKLPAVRAAEMVEGLPVAPERRDPHAPRGAVGKEGIHGGRQVLGADSRTIDLAAAGDDLQATGRPAHVAGPQGSPDAPAAGESITPYRAVAEGVASALVPVGAVGQMAPVEREHRESLSDSAPRARESGTRRRRQGQVVVNSRNTLAEASGSRTAEHLRSTAISSVFNRPESPESTENRVSGTPCTSRRPLAIDLFCGLGGWAEGFIAEGWDVIGFDIERHDYGTGGYPGQLVLQDVLTLHGSQFRGAAVIVASPPCQAYSYRAMPWKRAKALPPPDNSLFDACFRIQREASEAAGRLIPLIVENVKGAQRWVGRARWHYGSYYLFGDVPALMPSTLGRKNSGGSWFAEAHNTDSGHSRNPVTGEEGVKIGGPRGDDWFAHHNREEFLERAGVKQHGSVPEWFDTGIAQYSSRSDSRKAASAQIAKIPFPLAQWIARMFKPEADNG